MGEKEIERKNSEMSSTCCFCCRPTNLNPVKFAIPRKKVELMRPRRVGVRASKVESGSSNFVQRMEQTWLISQVLFLEQFLCFSGRFFLLIYLLNGLKINGGIR